MIKDGESQISFPLEYEVVFSCAMSDEAGSLVITGGFEGRKAVARVSLYNEEGFQSDLPSLNTARAGHGCASFVNKENERVNIPSAENMSNSPL